MSSEPPTKLLETEELMRFLDEVAADGRAEQRAQLASLKLTSRGAAPERTLALEPPQLVHPVRRAASRAPVRRASRDRARSEADADPARRAGDDAPSWLRPWGARLVFAVAGALAVFATVAFVLFSGMATSRGAVQRASVLPAPLPTARAAQRGPAGTLRWPERAAQPTRPASLSGSREDALATRPVDHERGSAKGWGTPRAQAASAGSLSLVPGQHCSRRDPPSSDRSAPRARRAVDLLLSGQSREALDAYRALAAVAPAAGVYREVVRLLEAELSDERAACGVEPCVP